MSEAPREIWVDLLSERYTRTDIAERWRDGLNEVRALGFGSTDDPRLREIWDIITKALSK